MYCDFLQLFLRKQLPAAAQNNAMRALRVNQNSKVAAGQINNELKLTIKLRKVMPLMLHYCHFKHCYYKKISIIATLNIAKRNSTKSYMYIVKQFGVSIPTTIQLLFVVYGITL